VTHTPAYKEASVRLVVLGENGDSPLPETTRDLAIAHRNAASKSSANGSARITEFRQPDDFSRDKDKRKRKRRLKIDAAQPSH